MQILANVTNTQIVRDPSGYISVGMKLKIPFSLCEADITAKVILLNEFPIINLAVEMPDGQLISPANAATFNATFQSNSHDTVTCSFPLPVLHGATQNHSGTWYAVLEVDPVLYKRYLAQDSKPNGSLKTKGTKYNVSMHSFSNLKMTSRLDQTSLEPGAMMNLHAYLTEYRIPLVQHASVVAEVERPDHTKTNVVLSESDPGVHQGSMQANMAGIYRFNVLATGVDYKGKPFTREQLHTGSVFAGGDNPVSTGGNDGRPGIAEACCKVMQRLGWITAILLVLILIALLRR
jgi:hypothetical protein